LYRFAISLRFGIYNDFYLAAEETYIFVVRIALLPGSSPSPPLVLGKSRRKPVLSNARYRINPTRNHERNQNEQSLYYVTAREKEM
jgi:hypothetical protein